VLVSGCDHRRLEASKTRGNMVKKKKQAHHTMSRSLWTGGQADM
jgi:hypothetical protein